MEGCFSGLGLLAYFVCVPRLCLGPFPGLVRAKLVKPDVSSLVESGEKVVVSKTKSS